MLGKENDELLQQMEGVPNNVHRTVKAIITLENTQIWATPINKTLNLLIQVCQLILQ